MQFLLRFLTLIKPIIFLLLLLLLLLLWAQVGGSLALDFTWEASPSSSLSEMSCRTLLEHHHDFIRVLQLPS